MRIAISFFILLGFQFCFGYNGMQTIGEKKFTVYKVQPKDTWTNLSKKYHITIKELQAANVGVTDLKIGQIIQVPMSVAVKENPSTQKEKISMMGSSTHNNNTGKNPVYYSVKPHETLYRISVNNKVSVDDLKKWNGLSSNNVSVDQRLIVGYGSEKVVEEKDIVIKQSNPIEKEETENKPVTETKPVLIKKDKEAKSDTSLVSGREIATATGVSKVVETGIVTWLADSEMNQNKFYALHRTAPIGTIIKVTNRMNNNSVFVKVVGALPTTGDNENIILKITQAAAQRIGALDQRFQGELTYGITQ